MLFELLIITIIVIYIFIRVKFSNVMNIVDNEDEFDTDEDSQ
jgi:hypothetical protein